MSSEAKGADSVDSPDFLTPVVLPAALHTRLLRGLMMGVVKLFTFEQPVPLVILNILQAINYALKTLVVIGVSIKLLQISMN